MLALLVDSVKICELPQRHFKQMYCQHVLSRIKVGEWHSWMANYRRCVYFIWGNYLVFISANYSNLILYVTALISCNLNSKTTTTARRRSVFTHSDRSIPSVIPAGQNVLGTWRCTQSGHCCRVGIVYNLSFFHAQGLPQVIINLTNKKQPCVRCIMSW